MKWSKSNRSHEKTTAMHGIFLGDGEIDESGNQNENSTRKRRERFQGCLRMRWVTINFKEGIRKTEPYMVFAHNDQAWYYQWSKCTYWFIDTCHDTQHQEQMSVVIQTWRNPSGVKGRGKKMAFRGKVQRFEPAILHFKSLAPAAEHPGCGTGQTWIAETCSLLDKSSDGFIC